MTAIRTYRVKDVARLAGVSVRTLHHYHAIGLLVPAARTDAGYRLYDDNDLLRLQQIMIQRELGLSLEDIHKALDDPAFNLAQALKAQHSALQDRARATAAMLCAVEQALAALSDKKGNVAMTQIFNGFDPAKYETEARERWGDTDAYAESAKRTARHTAADWTRMRDEQDAVYRAVAAALRDGVPSESSEAMDLAERHRNLIDAWFYPCSTTMHLGLAEMYEADSRFAENIDKYGGALRRSSWPPFARMRGGRARSSRSQSYPKTRPGPLGSAASWGRQGS